MRISDWSSDVCSSDLGVLADRDLGKDKFEGVQLGLESNRIYVPLASALARFRFQSQDDELDRFLLRIDDPARLAAGAGVLGAVLEQIGRAAWRKEWVSTCRSRWSPYPEKTHKT